jgi:hypothetical protein
MCKFFQGRYRQNRPEYRLRLYDSAIKEVKRHSFYLKPGEKKRVKEALARKRNRKKIRKEQD